MGVLQGYLVRIVSKARDLRRLAIAIPAALVALGLAWFGIAEVTAQRLQAARAPTELSERATLKKTVHDLFKRNDLAALDAMAASFRSGALRTQSGIWKLSLFYGAFQDLGATVARDDVSGWNDVSAKLLRWQQAYTSSPAPIIANAVALKARAWTLRPRQYLLEASTGESRFTRTLRLAADILDRSKLIAAADPHYFAVRADLATSLNESPGPFMERINEGLDKAPDYFPVYFAGINYFADANATERPDVARRIEAFANTAAKRLPAPDGSALYARLYWHAFTAVYGDDLFAKSQVDWSRMRSGIDAVLARYPDAWNRNNFAYMACLQRDQATTKRLLAGVTEPILSVWKAKPIFSRCQRWANAEPTDKKLQ
jgi:hypothetical protein